MSILRKLSQRPLLIGLLIITITATVFFASQPPASAEFIADNSNILYMPLIFKAPLNNPLVTVKYGVNFINSAEDPADAQQFQNGLSTGAGWNRWPLYWNLIETSTGQFDWSKQDTAVTGDITHGLQTNAILLGTPGFYLTRPASFITDPLPTREGALSLTKTEAAAPQGLYEPIFIGGDEPSAGKQINPANKWAILVFISV